MADTALQGLVERIGADHVVRRLGIEAAHEKQVFGQGTLLFNVENWKLAPRIIETALKVTGLHGRARRNADQVEVRHNLVTSARLPAAFDGFAMLQLSDLHADISQRAMRHLMDIVSDIACDICVLTGDYRGKTYGPFETSLMLMRDLCARIKLPRYGILGNHDSIRMTPALEAMGIRMLFNEQEPITRDGATIHLAGVDDAHFYRTDDIAKAAAAIPRDAFSILLAHTPESYRAAAAAGFDLMLSGHTHGGQLCLPGGIAIKLEARLPRRMGRGVWRFGELAGYTSAGAGTSLAPVRLNCPAEITVHTLRRLG
ncbi:putative MPP superfamily phosphohydrolase [Bradyrhizobium sp. USDA 4524]|uniref:metallophosphoesterase n=1 Tax=unclassified Bradyrhizobium TaxID=2631580 RepID=UPI00209CA7D2|nr:MULTISPECIES: metallophosphoesterase [unclassified Bradyrhizobium]MCP1840085.1 putative MPP superfamily phosphohydrolase [Bradyrhizobium sp. USDA 4538]MCP1900648.1 putative MPP superfamily phosphohydrolase [Bradyrhizobium sp. USDA 4537]MCP1993696.1 putative MPP superfamily phosphohydrolase [Bradyrhizobium sp. USDA 4539]